jgi:DNA polymerase I-like protein with 3'-5' exonuclease and polymerase domains
MMLKAGAALRSRPTALGLDAHLVLTPHDEIVVETRDELAENVVGIIEECLKEAYMGIVPEMPFELTMRIAAAWGD